MTKKIREEEENLGKIEGDGKFDCLFLSPPSTLSTKNVQMYADFHPGQFTVISYNQGTSGIPFWIMVNQGWF